MLSQALLFLFYCQRESCGNVSSFSPVMSSTKLYMRNSPIPKDKDMETYTPLLDRLKWNSHRPKSPIRDKSPTPFNTPSRRQSNTVQSDIEVIDSSGLSDMSLTPFTPQWKRVQAILSGSSSDEEVLVIDSSDDDDRPLLERICCPVTPGSEGPAPRKSILKQPKSEAKQNSVTDKGSSQLPMCDVTGKNINLDSRHSKVTHSLPKTIKFRSISAAQVPMERRKANIGLDSSDKENSPVVKSLVSTSAQDTKRSTFQPLGVRRKLLSSTDSLDQVMKGNKIKGPEIKELSSIDSLNQLAKENKIKGPEVKVLNKSSFVRNWIEQQDQRLIGLLLSCQLLYFSVLF